MKELINRHSCPPQSLETVWFALYDVNCDTKRDSFCKGTDQPSFLPTTEPGNGVFSVYDVNGDNKDMLNFIL